MTPETPREQLMRIAETLEAQQAALLDRLDKIEDMLAELLPKQPARYVDGDNYLNRERQHEHA